MVQAVRPRGCEWPSDAFVRFVESEIEESVAYQRGMRVNSTRDRARGLYASSRCDEIRRPVKS